MEPLDMDRFLDRWKLNVEGGAFAGRRAHINLSGMFLDDAVAHGETETGSAAAGFGGEERVKDAMNMFAGNAATGIRHFDFDAAIVRGSANFEHSSSGHGITRVQEKVQEDLLQLVGRPADGRKRFAKLLHHLNLRGFQRVRYKRQRLFHHAVYINVRGFRSAGARKIKQIVDDFAGAEGLLNDFFNDGLAGVAFRHLLRQHLNVIGNDRKGRVYFVRDTGREKPKRGQFFCLRHLLFHALPLGHIVEEQKTPDALIRFADQRSDRDVQSKQFALVMESLLIDAGNLFLVTPGGNFARQFFRQQRAELATNRFLACHSKQLLHARVPGFNDAVKIDGEHADIQGFDDVFAEILEACDFERFLFERAVELRVVQSDSNIPGNRLDQFDVVARQKIPINCLAEAEHRHGVLADTTRNKIIEVQLLKRAANGVTEVSCCTGRLKKKRPACKLGPGRLEETKIQGFGEPHTHGAGNAHLPWLHGVLDENCETVDQQRLRNPVHDRTQHGVETHFVRQRASEFDERAAVIKAIAVEKAVQARLDPLAERLEQKRGYDNGDHAAGGAVRGRMENQRDQRNQCEVNSGHASGCRCIGQAALEDNVHVHQAIADDRVAEAQRDQHQAQYRQLHPRAQGRAQHQRKNIQNRNGQRARKSSASEPFQLLAKDAGRSFAEAAVENQSRRQEAEGEKSEFDFGEQYV